MPSRELSNIGLVHKLIFDFAALETTFPQKAFRVAFHSLDQKTRSVLNSLPPRDRVVNLLIETDLLS